MTVKDVLRKELIGKSIKIVGSKNSHLIGISGEVIDETKNTISVYDGRRTRLVPKDNSVVEIMYLHDIKRKNDGEKGSKPKYALRFHASNIAKLPEDRIKSK